MISFLFWNLNRKPLTEILANVTLLHEVDVLMLAECSIPPEKLLEALNRGQPLYHYVPQIGCRKIDIFSKFADECLMPVREVGRMTIRHLNAPGITDVLLAVVHLPSRLRQNADSQVMECVSLSEEIEAAEEQIGHSRTILVGDLNMNPFESGIISAKGLHGVMTRQTARNGSRTVRGRSYRFFYNPMWGHFGDATPGPPGAYYYRRAEHNGCFWSIFDQVLVRPELLELFDNDNLKIIDSDGVRDFLSQIGTPDVKHVSDHLPIWFRLDLQEERGG